MKPYSLPVYAVYENPVDLGLRLNVSIKKHLSNAWGTCIKRLGNMAGITQEYDIAYHKDAMQDNTVDVGLLPDVK
jgi:hypothetical protein